MPCKPLRPPARCDNAAMTTIAAAPSTVRPGALYYRHTLPVRIMHWINVVALTVLFMSGLQIFNAFPVVHFGKSAYDGTAHALEIGVQLDANGEPRGVTSIAGHDFDTTGWLGLRRDADGEWVASTFPPWLMLPGVQWLSMARLWHFFFAWVFVVNGVAFLVYAVASRHLVRDLVPGRTELRGIGASVRDHLRFRRATGEAARRYNVLQKLAYLTVIFVLLPMAVITGLAMSPWFNAVLAGWVDLLGGRQSARALHFIVAWLLVAFALIHIFQLVVHGLWNHLRAMITGRYRLPAEPSP